jgi:hypothetical protein
MCVKDNGYLFEILGYFNIFDWKISVEKPNVLVLKRVFMVSYTTNPANEYL